MAVSEPFLVRSGRHPFYATVIESGGLRFRFDVGCMTATTSSGRALAEHIAFAKPTETTPIHWTAGLVLIIANWRMMHRRQAAHDAQGRMLLRVCATGDRE